MAHLPEKKRKTFIGETAMGLKPKKYRLFENGAKNAVPRPPLVIASKTECDSVTQKSSVNSPPFFFDQTGPFRSANIAAQAATSAANIMEWENPR